MKTLKKIKLNNLRGADLNQEEMNQLLGGNPVCGCGCHGSSTTETNQNANAANGYGSIGGNVVCWSWNGSSWDRISTK